MRTRGLQCKSTGNAAAVKGPVVSCSRRWALAVAALALTAWQAADGATLEPRTAGPITYLCGGVGQDEQQAMRAQAANFDRGLLFTKGARGQYMANVEVTLSRNNEKVASFKANGPRCLISGPDSSYQVTATYNGVERRATLARGQTEVHLRW